jgi:hypothetical protein
MKIIKARITAMPQTLFDRMPEVWVTLEDGQEEYLYAFYPDEISFSEGEFLGLAKAEAIHLKYRKDRDYLRS